MKIILEDYTIECSIEEYEILLTEGFLYKETLDNMKKVFFEPKRESNFPKVSMKKQTFDEDDIEFHIDENIKSIPKKKSDVDTKLNDDYFDDDDEPVAKRKKKSKDDDSDDDEKDENKQMETIKEVVAKNKEHLKKLIKDAIKKYGSHCDLNFIDASNVTDMSYTFSCLRFNGDISKWDVSKVEDMSCMFSYSDFNGDISKWDVSNVRNMSGMFAGSKFNNDISNWNVSKVEDMSYMFVYSKFNSDISKWHIHNNMKYIDIFKECPIKESNKPIAFQKKYDELL